MYDKRNNLSGQVAADVRENLGTLVYDTVIPRNVPAERGAIACGAGADLRPPQCREHRLSAAGRRDAGATGPVAGGRDGLSGGRTMAGMERKDSGAACRRCWPTSDPSKSSRPRRRRRWRRPTACRSTGSGRTRTSRAATSSRRISRILAASIREKGVIQPLILRPHPTKAGDYEIVVPASGAGGRRSSPACTRCRRWCATWPTPRCSSSRSSRTQRRSQPARGGAGATGS